MSEKKYSIKHLFTKLKSVSAFKSITFLKRPSVGQIIFWVGAIALTVLVAIFVRNFVSCWRLTSLPGVPPLSCKTYNAGSQFTPAENGEGTPVAGNTTPTTEIAAPEIQLPPPWDGASRINFLFIGLDYRDWEAGEGAPRSDTMILFTIDPASKTAGMLSIPRDMWVNIPGSGYGKINTAYSIGEGAKLPGGGPGLAMKTVEQFLGIPIQYYAQIDFYTFIGMINEIGGIDVQVDQKLVLDPIGTGMDHVVVKPGLRHMDGQRALAFARTRKTEGSDVDRAKRQQKVIMAIRDKVLNPVNFPMLNSKAPALYSQLSAGIRHNLSLDDAVRLAVFSQQIPVESIKTGVINYKMVTLGKSPDGLDIMKPMPDKIRVLRDEIFTTGGALSPKAVGDTGELMRSEAARVRVLNGSYGLIEGTGLAVRTQAYLVSQGMNVIEAGNADKQYDRSVVILHSGKLYTLRYFVNLLNIDSNALIIFKFDPNATSDVDIMLGNDWARTNPLPPAS